MNFFKKVECIQEFIKTILVHFKGKKHLTLKDKQVSLPIN
jgi:hypothetical protein